MSVISGIVKNYHDFRDCTTYVERVERTVGNQMNRLLLAFFLPRFCASNKIQKFSAWLLWRNSPKKTVATGCCCDFDFRDSKIAQKSIEGETLNPLQHIHCLFR